MATTGGRGHGARRRPRRCWSGRVVAGDRCRPTASAGTSRSASPTPAPRSVSSTARRRAASPRRSRGGRRRPSPSTRPSRPVADDVGRVRGRRPTRSARSTPSSTRPSTPTPSRPAPVADIADSGVGHAVRGAAARRALACAQAAFDELHARGGRLVFVTPTVALTGAARARAVHDARSREFGRSPSPRPASGAGTPSR